MPFGQMLTRAPVSPPGSSFGPDIDALQALIADPARPKAERADFLTGWISRHQPCLFGRLAAREMKDIALDVCLVDETDLVRDEAGARNYVQAARRQWKRRAAEGAVQGFVVAFCGPTLMQLMPGPDLVEICLRLAGLYLPEHAPVRPDLIYSEAVPLRAAGGQLGLFKGGVNMFYPGAHRTRNHDRRAPGGIIISTNSVGHWANVICARGSEDHLGDAVRRAADLALRSIGNGGLGAQGVESTSWHNQAGPDAPPRRLRGGLPRHIPADHSEMNYSALYHTDVLVPEDVTADAAIGLSRGSCPVWRDLSLDYISEVRVGPHDPAYGFFHGVDAAEEAIYFNPWPPEAATGGPERPAKQAISSFAQCPRLL